MNRPLIFDDRMKSYFLRLRTNLCGNVTAWIVEKDGTKQAGYSLSGLMYGTMTAQHAEELAEALKLPVERTECKDEYAGEPSPEGERQRGLFEDA